MASKRASASRRLRLVVLCGAVPAVLCAALAALRPSPLTRADNLVYDMLSRAMSLRAASERVVIVDVDEQSLSAIGQWPWRRDIVGRLITRLRDQGASVVALDIIFAEPDRHQAVFASVGRTLDAAPAPDDLFAEGLRGGRVVLGYAMTFESNSGARRPCVLHPIGLAWLQPRADDGPAPLFRATGAVCSLPLLSDAAGASGFLNGSPDNDGILRRVPLLIEYEERVYPSLALAAVNAATRVKSVTLRTVNASASSLSLANRSIPLDGKGNLMLRYRGNKKSFPYFSAVDALNGTLPEHAVRDKIVFVGTTALGTREVVATPLDTLFAGVEVQATVADNLLQEDFIWRSQYGTTQEMAEALSLGLLLAAACGLAGLKWAAILAALGILGVWGGSLWQLSSAGAFTSPLMPILSAGSALGAMTLARFAVERERAESAGRDKTTAQALMVQTLLSLTETRDGETGRHSRRTQRYAQLLAEQLSTHADFRAYLTPGRIELMSSLAPLHDIGKVGIPDHILNKPGPLTEEEKSEMRKHPELGYDVILRAEQQVGVRDDTVLAMAKDIVYTHHERWDGSGYPRGLRGTDIPLAGRIMALVDVYDAAVTRTLYQASRSHDDAVRYILSGKGTHFDPAIVDAFLIVAPALRQVALDVES